MALSTLQVSPHKNQHTEASHLRVRIKRRLLGSIEVVWRERGDVKTKVDPDYASIWIKLITTQKKHSSSNPGVEPTDSKHAKLADWLHKTRSREVH